MGLLDLYDSRFLAVAGRGDGLARDRAELLRQRLAARLVPAFGDDPHTAAAPAVGGYLERAIELYIAGFSESAIIEADMRVRSLLAAWVGGGDFAASARRAFPDGDVADRLIALAAKRDAIDARDRDLAASIVAAPARGASSGGLAAVRAESPTSQRLRWTADLHDLIAAAALACASAFTAIAQGRSACGSTST